MLVWFARKEWLNAIGCIKMRWVRDRCDGRSGIQIQVDQSRTLRRDVCLADFDEHWRVSNGLNPIRTEVTSAVKVNSRESQESTKRATLKN